MQISTLRPGLLVSLKSQIVGGVSYATREIEAEHLDDDGAMRAKWETDKTVENPEEHAAAVKVRGRARSLITGICSGSTFGLLCPEHKRDALMAAIWEAREVSEEFNATARVTRISVNVIIGRVAQDDVEAVRAINSEVRDLMDAMESGLRGLDVEKVRDAANKARSISAMLSPEAAARAKVAIDTARSAARQIVKAGETAAIEIDETVMRNITSAKAAFLDLDDAVEIQAPVVVGRAVDFEEMPPMDAPPAIPPARTFADLEF